MEFLKAHLYLLALPVLLLAFLLSALYRRRKKRGAEAEAAQIKRRDEALTEALQNPRVREQSSGRGGPVEIKWDDKAVSKGKAKAATMVELVELSAYSRRKYIFHADSVISIGSASDNQLPLPREGVAKRHCEIFMDGSRPGARNVQGARTMLRRGKKTAPISGEGVYLKNGDRIQIGSAEVEFRLFKA